MEFGGTDVDGVIESYAVYLSKKYPENFKRFELLREAKREAAMAEAIVFGVLQSLNLSPEVDDQVGIGGADFLCAGSTLSFAMRRIIPPSPEDRFIVEATCLDPDAVTDRSKIPNEVPEEIGGGPFGLLTRSICNKAKDKATQLGGYDAPRVLAIASSHAGIAALFNAGGAEYALVSEPHWRVGVPGEHTDLAASVFMRPNPDKQSIVPCRQSISAILLIPVFGDKSEVFGILHPEPAKELNIKFFPKVPFIRIANWPIKEDGQIFTEWVIADPVGHDVYHWKIQLPKEAVAE